MMFHHIDMMFHHIGIDEIHHIDMMFHHIRIDVSSYQRWCVGGWGRGAGFSERAASVPHEHTPDMMKHHIDMMFHLF